MHEAAPPTGQTDLRLDLQRHAPFSQMAREHVDEFLAQAQPSHFAPGDVLLGPASGPVTHLYLVQRGTVVGQRGIAEAAGGFSYEAGDLFPVGAAVGGRAVTATYTAIGATTCLLLPVARMRALADRSPPFAEFLNHRVVQLLELSRRALQASVAAQSLSEQSLEMPLGGLPRRAPFSLPPGAPVGQALREMHERRIGSVLVLGDDRHALGILTRHDVIGRVTLPGVPLDAPLSEVMSAPVHTLSTTHTAQDAIVLMSRHGIRHVPVTEHGHVVSIVSERDLFALQRLSVKHVSGAIRQATDVEAAGRAAGDIRRLARSLLGQGVGARQVTELISHLNDLLAQRLVEIQAAIHGLDLSRACWLAFGSEGRGEQTIATDQDNGLVFVADDGDDLPALRARWLAMAQDVNQALDACGYPLCKGQIMASNPACCLTLQEWATRFDAWMEHGAPQDLLNASIYFDLRGVAGRFELAGQLRERITAQAVRLPRFMKQMALNALTHRPPLNWRGAIDTHRIDGRDVIDLKLQGTAIYVDAARIYALAHAIPATGTRARLQAVAAALGLAQGEGESWVSGFEVLQSLRLKVQITEAALPVERANLIDVDALNEIERRVLRESLRVARRLQQRLELDYQR